MTIIDNVLNDGRKDDLISAAKDYISKKLSIIPVGKNKIPLIPWKEFCDRIATPEEVDEWFKRFPDAQLGMVTGKVSGITVVDVEASGGETEWKKLPQNCPVVKTGGGGRHYWFLYEESVKNGVRVEGDMKDTDIRNNGGYVILPPSISDKGSYEWVRKMPPAPFPKNIFRSKDIDIFKVTGASSNGNLDNRYFSLLNFYDGKAEGGRNDSIVKFIGYILTKIHPDDWEKYAWPLTKEANFKNTPPLPEYELRRSFDSIRETEKSNSPNRFTPSSEKVDLEWTDSEDDVRLLSEVAKSQKIDLSNPMPMGIELFDKEIRGGLFPGDLVIVAASPGHGKCHGKGTKILMYDGSIKNVEDIKVGDQLMGDDSTPRNVLSLARGREMLYEIYNKRTDSYIVNESHILSLEKYNRAGDDEVSNISVRDFLNLPDYRKRKMYGYKRGVSFKEKKVEVDPYFLGIWLGDGTSSNTGITTSDKEIVKYLNDYAKKINHKVRVTEQENNLSNVYSITRDKKFEPVDSRSNSGYGDIKSLKSMLSELGVVDNKHIPDIYKINSRKNRLKLLAGIFDTDGYLADNTGEILTKHKRLADDITYLCRSLGIFCYYKPKYNKEYDRYYYRIKLWGNLEDLPTKVPRRKFKKRKQIKNHLRYSIEAKPLSVGDYYGFEIDGNHLYLLGDFSVTHNTSFSQFLSYNFAKINNEKILFFSYEVLTQFVWEKFQTMGMKEADALYTPFKHTTGNLKWVEKKISEAKEKYGVKFVVIDHLGFLESGRSKNKESYSLELGHIARELKSIAKREEVAIVVPAHVRKRSSGEKKSVTSLDMDDIAYSSGPYQEADLVFLMKREENTATSTVDIFTNYTLISLAKNRRGPKNPRGFFTLVNDLFVRDPSYVGVENMGKDYNYKPPIRKTEEEINKDLEEEHKKECEGIKFIWN